MDPNLFGLVEFKTRFNDACASDIGNDSPIIRLGEDRLS